MSSRARRAVLHRLLAGGLVALAACGGGNGGGSGGTATPTPVPVPAGAGPSSGPVAGDGGRRVVNVRDSGAAGDGVTNDAASIRRALAAAVTVPGTDVYFPPGRYFLGDGAGDSVLLTLAGARDLRILGNGAVLTCRSRAGINHMLMVAGSSDLWIHGLVFHDEGLDRTLTWQGANALLLDGSVVNGVQRMRLSGCRFESVLSALTVSGVGYAVDDIAIESIEVEGCYYGLAFQENGNRVRATGVRCNDVARAYLAYGVDDHVLEIASASHPGGSNEFLVKCYDRPTSNITLDLTLAGERGGEGMVVLEHEHAAGEGLIRDVRLRLDLATATCRAEGIFLLRSYHPAQPARPEATTRSIWRNLHIDGNFQGCAANTPFFRAVSTPTTERTLVRVGPGVPAQLVPVPAPEGFDFVRVAAT